MADSPEAGIPEVANRAVGVLADVPTEVFAMGGVRPQAAFALLKVASHLVVFVPVVAVLDRCRQAKKGVGWGGHRLQVGLPATALVLHLKWVN